MRGGDLKEDLRYLDKPTELQSHLIVKKQKSQNMGKVNLTNIDQQAIPKSFFKNGTMCMKFFQFFFDTFLIS